MIRWSMSNAWLIFFYSFSPPPSPPPPPAVRPVIWWRFQRFWWMWFLRFHPRRRRRAIGGAKPKNTKRRKLMYFLLIKSIIVWRQIDILIDVLKYIGIIDPPKALFIDLPSCCVCRSWALCNITSSGNQKKMCLWWINAKSRSDWSRHWNGMKWFPQKQAATGSAAGSLTVV